MLRALGVPVPGVRSAILKEHSMDANQVNISLEEQRSMAQRVFSLTPGSPRVPGCPVPGRLINPG